MLACPIIGIIESDQDRSKLNGRLEMITVSIWDIQKELHQEEVIKKQWHNTAKRYTKSGPKADVKRGEINLELHLLGRSFSQLNWGSEGGNKKNLNTQNNNHPACMHLICKRLERKPM